MINCLLTQQKPPSKSTPNQDYTLQRCDDFSRDEPTIPNSILNFQCNTIDAQQCKDTQCIDSQDKNKINQLMLKYFTDKSFHLQHHNAQLKQHISYLQSLKNIPRRSYEYSNIKVLLKTQYPVIHNLIHKYFNYKFYQKQDQFNDIFLIWMDSYVSEQFIKRLKGYQKINHFPSSCQLGRKDLLSINLNLAKSFLPEHYQFYPKTWVLPRDYESYMKNKTQNNFLIVKPHANCQGRGIYLTKNPSFSVKEEVIVQEYIDNPMLIDGFKFDLRIYVMLRSLDPLRIYIYKQGLCRLATSKYIKPNDTNFKNDKMHLTNYAINKLSPNFIGNRDIKQDNQGHKRSYTSAMQYLQEKGFDIHKIQDRIDLIIFKTFLSTYTKMNQSYKKTRSNNINYRNIKEFTNYKQDSHRYYQNDNSHEQSVCFQLFGFDIMLLQSGQPILLEVNHQPSFVTDSPLDLGIKKCLLMDTINILDINQKDKQLWQNCKNNGALFKHKLIQESQLQNIGGYRRIYPLNQIKLQQTSKQSAEKYTFLMQFYEGLMNKIIFRQFKHINKIRLNHNYKTISSKQQTRVHISKYKPFESKNSTPSELPNQKSSNHKSIALTFYNLFNNSKYHIVRNKPVHDVTFDQIDENKIKNHILLESIQKESSKKIKEVLNEKRGLSVSLEKIHLLQQTNIAQLHKRELQINRLHKEKIQTNQENTQNRQKQHFLNIPKNFISSKSKGLVNYISSNRSKKLIQCYGNPEIIDSEEYIPIYSHIEKGNNISFREGTSEKQQRRTQISAYTTINTNFSQPKSENASKNKITEYRQIYGNSIKQKIQRINNLKIIKNNLKRLNFVTFLDKKRNSRNFGGLQIGSEEQEVGKRNIITRQ